MDFWPNIVSSATCLLFCAKTHSKSWQALIVKLCWWDLKKTDPLFLRPWIGCWKEGKLALSRIQDQDRGVCRTWQGRCRWFVLCSNLWSLVCTLYEQQHVSLPCQTIERQRCSQVMQQRFFVMTGCFWLALPIFTNSYVFNIVRHVESIFDVKPHYHSISLPRWRKFQLKWYIILSVTSLVFLSMLSLPTTVPLTTNPHEQKVGKWSIQ